MPRNTRSQAPAAPRLPSSLTEEDVADLSDEVTFRGMEIGGSGLAAGTATAAEFTGCRFLAADLTGTLLRRSAFTDCRFERSNLANLRTERSRLTRVTLDATRLTGLHWTDGVLRDVAVTGCRADLAVFRFTRFGGVTFDDCNLSRADFQNADLSGVRFTGCDLTGAQFSHATLEGARFAGCDLAGVGGVTSFRGAIVTGNDLMALAHTLAAALGITIEP
jgi:uncharacterized protein YjbI with pentapeptide repeats